MEVKNQCLKFLFQILLKSRTSFFFILLLKINYNKAAVCRRVKFTNFQIKLLYFFANFPKTLDRVSHFIK